MALDLQGWTRSPHVTRDVVMPGPFERLALALSLDPLAEGEPLPPLWHWLLFTPATAAEATGDDGHPRRGGFLPPLPHRRRMYAGGQVDFHVPLSLGATATRRGEVIGIVEKSGRTGDLVLVTVRYEVTVDGQLAITERQDLVFTDARPRPRTANPPTLVPAAKYAGRSAPDEVMLFRFSALTFNSHRIHYDRAYATEREGYEDLVVHGPLTAILLADLVRRHEPRAIASFSFSSRAPLYVGEEIELRAEPAGTGIAATAYRPEGLASMSADIDLA